MSKTTDHYAAIHAALDYATYCGCRIRDGNLEYLDRLAEETSAAMKSLRCVMKDHKDADNYRLTTEQWERKWADS